jgi:hypothetical protein
LEPLSDQYLANQEESLAKEPEPPATTTTTEATEPEIEIAGVVNWNRPSGIAFGAATSLYERHPVSGETAGNPLADVSHNTFLNELFFSPPAVHIDYSFFLLGIRHRDTL